MVLRNFKALFEATVHGSLHPFNQLTFVMNECNEYLLN